MQKNTHKIAEGIRIASKRFQNIDTQSTFFDSFKRAYGSYYFTWLKEKSNDIVTVVEKQDGEVIGFLKLKVEDETENYSDLTPVFPPLRRIKISSLKALPNNYKIGSQLMSISLEFAEQEGADEIYATILQKCEYYDRMVGFLKKWGFEIVATKFSHDVMEDVLVRPMKI